MVKNVLPDRNKEGDFVFHVQDRNLDDELRDRLRVAVRKAGGNSVVSQDSGVPKRTIGRYLAGQEMKLHPLIALAKACGVTLEWLATGKEAPSAPVSAAPAPALPPKLFSFADMDQLGAAIDGAQAAFAAQGKIGKGRALAQVACLLYDESKNRAAEAGETTPFVATAGVTTN